MFGFVRADDDDDDNDGFIPNLLNAFCYAVVSVAIIGVAKSMLGMIMEQAEHEVIEQIHRKIDTRRGIL